MAEAIRRASASHMGSRFTWTGTPSRAAEMAGANSWARGLVPKRQFSSAHPAGAPGTMVGIHPALGIAWCPISRTMAADRAAGATPLAFRP